MRKAFLYIGMFIAMWGLWGCLPSKKTIATVPIKIIWKSPGVKFADMAFMRIYPDSTELELYHTAHALASFRVYEDHVCGKAFACMSADAFNARYLSKYYTKDTLYRLLHKQPLSFLPKPTIRRHGFTQQARKKEKYDVVYKVLKNRVEFHDTINAIDIVIIILEGHPTT